MWLEDENHNIPRGPHPTSGSWTEGLEGFMKKIPGTENDNPSVVTMPAHVLDRQRRVLWWPVFNLTCVEEKHN
jgi:hypothetical protein